MHTKEGFDDAPDRINASIRIATDLRSTPHFVVISATISFMGILSFRFSASNIL